MRKQIAAANWKMNLSLAQAMQLMDELIESEHSLSKDQQAIFAVPFPYLLPVQDKLKGKQNVFVAAQNCSANKNGAFTGEVSAEMLAGINISHVIIGHSERREYNHESNQELAEKLNRAFENNIKPIFCCGEPLKIREEGTQNTFVETQLKESLFHLSKEQMQDFIIAYEPIWAIGTGKTATADQAEEVCAFIRSTLAKIYDNATAEAITIQYGGSMNAKNCAELLAKTNVDGGLIGGASLKAADFNTIVQAAVQG